MKLLKFYIFFDVKPYFFKKKEQKEENNPQSIQEN